MLDEASRALVLHLHNELPRELRATGQRLDALIAHLEQTLLADTALNQQRLRPQIAREIVRRGRTEFAMLNAWIYDEVFRSPQQDEWIGLLPRNVFTVLAGRWSRDPLSYLRPWQLLAGLLTAWAKSTIGPPTEHFQVRD